MSEQTDKLERRIREAERKIKDFEYRLGSLEKKMSQKIKPSVITHLKEIAKILKGLELYSNAVDGKDMTDVLFYGELLDKINGKIKEMGDSK